MLPADAEPTDLARAVLAEFALGELLNARRLAAGSPYVVTLTGGTFVLKRSYRARDVDLQAEVAPLLTRRGIRQAGVVRTAAGRLVTESGYFLQEFLPGSIARAPSAAQIAAAMRHVAAYHRELGQLPVSYQPGADSLWQRVADPGFLLGSLPDLVTRHGLGGADIDAALAYLAASRMALAALPRQVVHGDIGPDNVLMSGNEVVSLIDFTPFQESVLFAACTALYWYHVYGSPLVSVDQLRASLAEMGAARPWRKAEIALWPAGLVREALRRLATPLELARENGGELSAAVGRSVEPRRAAVAAITKLLAQLGLDP